MLTNYKFSKHLIKNLGDYKQHMLITLKKMS